MDWSTIESYLKKKTQTGEELLVDKNCKGQRADPKVEGEETKQDGTDGNQGNPQEIDIIL